MKTIKLGIRHLVIASFLTILILGRNVNAKGTETRFASSYENSVEPELTIEDWMAPAAAAADRTDRARTRGRPRRRARRRRAFGRARRA